MRELKFRAYIVPLKRYATGLDTIQFHKCCDVTGAGIWSVVTVNGGIFEGDDIIIEQYTGLKDKDGKEIYEGGIVDYNDGDCIGYVVYNAPNFEIMERTGFTCWLNGGHHQRVIGNIHENPELIGKEIE